MSEYHLNIYPLHEELNMASRVYNTIKDNIIYWDLKPGTIMSENAVAQQLGVSRTPIREAFIKLRNEGLVDVTPQKGTSVSLIDTKRIQEECFIRESLELAVLKLIPQEIPKKNLDELHHNLELQETAVAENNIKELLRLDDEFHCSIFAICGNQLGWQMISDTCSHYKRIRYFSLCSSDRCRSVYDQHVEIYLSLKNKRQDKLIELYRSHIGALSSEEAKMREKNREYFY